MRGITPVRRTLVITAALLVLCGLSACGSSSDPSASTSAPAGAPEKASGKTNGSGDAEPPPAPPRRILGGSDSACDLPFQFALAAKWKPGKVSVDFDQGGFRAVCEVDAKPAGNLGIMRIWLPKK